MKILDTIPIKTMTRKEHLQNQISVLSDLIRERNIKVQSLQDEVEELKNINKFDEEIVNLHKQELSKIK